MNKTLVKFEILIKVDNDLEIIKEFRQSLFYRNNQKNIVATDIGIREMKGEIK